MLSFAKETFNLDRLNENPTANAIVEWNLSEKSANNQIHFYKIIRSLIKFNALCLYITNPLLNLLSIIQYY